MDSIITYLITYNQYLISIIGELLLFISQHIPLKQMIFDDSNSPEYQKFKVDRLPTILRFEKVDISMRGSTFRAFSLFRNRLTVPSLDGFYGLVIFMFLIS